MDESEIQWCRDPIAGRIAIVDRHPRLFDLRIDQGLVGAGVEKPQIVPARAGPLRHRVGFSLVALAVVVQFVQDRERLAPEVLPAEEPIAQLVVDRAAPLLGELIREPTLHRFATLDVVHAVEHVYAAARSVRRDQKEIWRLRLQWTDACWKGRMSEVISWLCAEQRRIGKPLGRRIDRNVLY